MERGTDGVRTGVAFALVASILLGVPVATARASALSVRAPGLPRAGEPRLAVDPPSWWMFSGANLSIGSAWLDLPPECSIASDWFLWEVASESSAGILNATTGATVEFVALPDAGGETTLLVRSAASLACPSGPLTVYGTAESNVTVDAPLLIANLSVSPGALHTGGSAVLAGDVLGGEPPFTVNVSWGDGSSNEIQLGSPGLFSLIHGYPIDGSFRAQVSATDGRGETSTDSVEEPEYVSQHFTTAIDPNTWTGEVGVPVRLGVTANDGDSFTSFLNCGNATPGPGDFNGSHSDLTCTFTETGTCTITLLTVDPTAGAPPTRSTLRIPVVPPPSVTGTGDGVDTEVGDRALIPVTLSGGVGPFSLHWTAVGLGTNGTTRLTSDQSLTVLVAPVESGAGSLRVDVIDSLGVRISATVVAVSSAPELQLTAQAAVTVQVGEEEVAVSASAAQGSGPIGWLLTPPPSLRPSSLSVGLIEGPSTIGWNGTVRAEGNLELRIGAVDACGTVRWLNVSVALPPEFVATATLGATNASSVELNLSIIGGMPPYRYVLSDSDNDTWNGSIAAAGSFELVERVAEPGPVAFNLTVSDALGFARSHNFTLILRYSGTGGTAGTAPPNVDPLLLGGAVAVGVVAVALGALLWRRRPSSRALPPPPDPVGVLRGIIEPCDGVDRAVVDLLAEEQGVDRTVTSQTLERLRSEGIVRSERGPDGEEVLAWREPLRSG